MSATTAQSDSKTNSSVPAEVKNFRNVFMTLYIGLLPESAFKETPSQVDGLDREIETDLRIAGCELIQTAGILLKLPQVAMTTGQIYLQRFFYKKSFVRYPLEFMAMGSIFLASKVEENPRCVRDVINVFRHIKQVRAQKIISPLIDEEKLTEMKNHVIKAEGHILKELGFCVHVKHAHKLIIMYLQVLEYEKNSQLMQMSLNYMNDALRTDVFMRFPPETIACACIYLTARKINLPLPNNPHWFLLFKVSEEDIREVCMKVLHLYKRPKVNFDELESKVDLLKKILQANRLVAQVQDSAKKEGNKTESPTASTSTDMSSHSKNDESPKTPPLTSEYHDRHELKKGCRSRSPYDHKSESSSSSKRSKYHSKERGTNRSKERRPDNKRYKYQSRDRDTDLLRVRRSDDIRYEYKLRGFEKADRSRERRSDDKGYRDNARNRDNHRTRKNIGENKRHAYRSRDRDTDRSRERSREKKSDYRRDREFSRMHKSSQHG